MGGIQGTTSVVDADAHQVVSALFEMLGGGDATQNSLVASELAANPAANRQFRRVVADAERALQMATTLILQREREGGSSVPNGSKMCQPEMAPGVPESPKDFWQY